MKIIRKEDRVEWTSKTVKGYEYPFKMNNLDFALANVKGRYPIKGWFRNTKVDMIIYCQRGHGKIVLKNETFELTKDDAVSIEKNRWYYWDETTNGDFIEIYNPAWSESQGETRTTI